MEDLIALGVVNVKVVENEGGLPGNNAEINQVKPGPYTSEVSPPNLVRWRKDIEIRHAYRAHKVYNHKSGQPATEILLHIVHVILKFLQLSLLIKSPF